MRTLSSLSSSSRLASMTLLAGLAAALVGCAAPPAYPTYPTPNSTTYPSTVGYPAGNTQPGYIEYGRVIGIEVVRVQEPARASGAGVVIGGIAGGVLGSQVGQGSGRDIATIAGIAGGALAGNAIEKNSQAQQIRDIYRVSVQIDNGTTRAYDVASVGDLRSGDRVRIENGQVYRY